MLKNWIAASAFATAFCLTAGMPNAQAMPMGNAGSRDAQVILVSGGCGPYWHRGPYGGSGRVANGATQAEGTAESVPFLARMAEGGARRAFTSARTEAGVGRTDEITRR
jgi:hypothetical protein